jgi:hypothetical protein
MRKLLFMALLVAGFQAGAADDPAAAYQRMHQAILGRLDPSNVIQHLNAATRSRFDKDSQASGRFMVDMMFMKDDMPRVYTITSNTQSGNSARITATGTGARFYTPVTMDGTVDLVLEGGV